MNGWTLVLAVVLAFAGGWVWRGVFDLLRSPRRAERVDLSAAAARGELLRLDWDDPRQAAGVDEKRAAG